MSETIICALISAAVTLLVSIGTWQVSVKKDRDKAKEELRTTLNTNINTIKGDLESLKVDISGVNATVQNQISIVELKIQTLSDRVEKHNNVIERVYKLEQSVADLKEV